MWRDGPNDRTREGAISLEDPPASVLKILNGALQALGDRGAQRLSISDICHVSGVSRGTLYNYFSTKDDVLAAVSEHISLAFENGVRAVAQDLDDPVERLRAVMRFHDEYSAGREADKMLLVEPAFVVNFFRTHFERHKRALLDALGPVFDHFDTSRKEPIDREGVAEMLIRLQVSRVILPVDGNWKERWENLGASIEAMLPGPR